MLEAISEGTRENSNGSTANKPHRKLLFKKSEYISLKAENIFPFTHLKS
jgi:hypothetical protein